MSYDKLPTGDQWPQQPQTGKYECTKCGSIDLDVPPTTAGCGPKLYYGLTPEEYLNRYGKPRPA